ncbi:MAG: NAD(P)H-dependent oxidoreductase [Planctomycetaceae bacterium]|nr:NAD(P)H-dependent oxidoreductase [Planctomycetaceae bacterium]
MHPKATSNLNILKITASARRQRSLSRKLASKFIAEWIDRRPDDVVVEQDVAANPPPIVTEEWIAAAFTAGEDRSETQKNVLSSSDELISELEDADIIVIATPMYNYGMPATLKAWFDQVIRINKTFSFDLKRGDFPLQPILGGKTLVVLTSTGEFGFLNGGIRSNMNHLLPHISTCAFYLGVDEDDIHHVGIEYQEFQDDRHEQSIDDAGKAISALVVELCQDIG